MKILQIIRRKDDALARRIIDDIRRDGAAEQTLLLIHDAVYLKIEGMAAFACTDDVRARGIETDAALVDYAEIVDMIFEHDKVITW